MAASKVAAGGVRSGRHVHLPPSDGTPTRLSPGHRTSGSSMSQSHMPPSPFNGARDDGSQIGSTATAAAHARIRSIATHGDRHSACAARAASSTCGTTSAAHRAAMAFG